MTLPLASGNSGGSISGCPCQQASNGLPRAVRVSDWPVNFGTAWGTAEVSLGCLARPCIGWQATIRRSYAVSLPFESLMFLVALGFSAFMLGYKHANADGTLLT